MVAVNKQLLVRQVSKSIDRIIILSANFKTLLVLREPGYELPEQADRCQNAG